MSEQVTVQCAFGFVTEQVDETTMRYRIIGGQHRPVPSAYVVAAIIADLFPAVDVVEGWGVHVDAIPEGLSADASVLVWAPTAAELRLMRQLIARANVTERWDAMMSSLRTINERKN